MTNNKNSKWNRSTNMVMMVQIEKRMYVVGEIVGKGGDHGPLIFTARSQNAAHKFVGDKC